MIHLLALYNCQHWKESIKKKHGRKLTYILTATFPAHFIEHLNRYEQVDNVIYRHLFRTGWSLVMQAYN
jgi:hypothetical protein